MACKYTYNGQTYTKDEFYSLVRTTMVQPRTVQKYNKILFPTGNTASKIEGHTTLEEFKKQKEDRIKELESIILNKSELLTEFEKNDDVYLNYHGFQSEYNFVRIRQNFWNKKYDIDDKRTLSGDNYDGYVIQEYTNGKPHKITEITKEKALELIKKSDEGIYEENLKRNQDEINQLKQELERVETEGFGALKPIYNFYEIIVTNILNKQYGKNNVNKITDEYGNTWNELVLKNIVTPVNDSNLLNVSNFDTHFPDYSYLSDYEKQIIIDSVYNGNLSISCSI